MLSKPLKHSAYKKDLRKFEKLEQIILDKYKSLGGNTNSIKLTKPNKQIKRISSKNKNNVIRTFNISNKAPTTSNNKTNILNKIKTEKELLSKKMEKDLLDEYNIHIDKISNSFGFKYQDNKDKKSEHRLNCFKGLRILKNIKIKEFGDITNEKETFLIEFRPLPHLEFLVRNIILKLPDWNHSIVCGNLNYEFIKNMCNSICKDSKSKINIIRLNKHNCTTSEYSQLLATIDFWNNFKGEKLLLYQEDTMLFHNNINPFLKYDYVGAPWPKAQDDNSYLVGNGGFSLRSKSKMIECIQQVNPSELPLGNSTKGYMRSTGNTFVPEDVYFSKSMIDYNLGNVATWEIANKFSQESQKSINPLGGHNFFLAKNNQLKVPVLSMDLNTSYYKEANHRYGWKSLVNNLIEKNIITLDNSSDIELIDVMESYFCWNRGKINITKRWIGIFHFCDNIPSFYDVKMQLEHIVELVVPYLEKCIGIITLSNNKFLKSYFERNNINIPIITIKHPMVEMDNFNLEQFKKLDNYKIIQLGLQYRRVSDIYRIKSNYEKLWLCGTRDYNNCKQMLERELKYMNIPYTTNTVTKYRTKTVEEYDDLLRSNIVIIPLWAASANNSVLECFVQNIPAFISRLPATEEYLGQGYPMFYNELEEIEHIINNRELLHQKYTETYNYLVNRDKSDVYVDHFNSELLKFVHDCDLLSR